MLGSSTLPPLRKNLTWFQGIRTFNGEPTWTIRDPARNRYFQIGWIAYQILERWDSQSINRLVERVNAETTSTITEKHVQDLLDFLSQNQLTDWSSTRNTALATSGEHQHWIKWLIHHYLFLRIPLVRPNRFLQGTLPWITPLFTPTAAYIVLAVGATGLYLVSRQWEYFWRTFLYFFNFEGIVLYASALCLVKLVHELAHAYTATRYGCRVSSIGIAFMVLFPVIYSDTSEAWRLVSRKERLHIGAAGLIVELCLALIATFFWSFLPDGAGRSVAFLIATTSCAVAISINLNPFMRFDGYYLLSDWLGVPNLQDRSFAMGRWKLRTLLFGSEEPPPEFYPPKLKVILILYAWSTWVYRLLLFTGIALLVYQFCFKALGLLLFAIEVLWFILVPIGSELKNWWTMRHRLWATYRSWQTLAVLVLILVASILPLPLQVSLPAVLQNSSYATIYAPGPSQILAIYVREGQYVEANTIILQLESPLVEKDVALTKGRIDQLEIYSLRNAAHSSYRENLRVFRESLTMQHAELDGLVSQRDRLSIRAPFTGVITDLVDGLRPGRWVNEKLRLGDIVDRTTAEILAYATADDIGYLSHGQQARFIPEDLTRATITGLVQEIVEIDEEDFRIPYQASLYGGSIPVRMDEHGKLVPERSYYRVRLTVGEVTEPLTQAIRGQIIVASRPWSLAGRLFQRLINILIREGGL